ncbi:MAG: type II toxin-antitoxin system RelE/ParE family toxin [Burkholderiales bacterium]
MVWKIEFGPAAIKELRKLDSQTARRIIAFLRLRVAKLDDPRAIGQALSGEKLGDYWKYRVGDWRITAKIEDKKQLILVLRVGNRRDVYK